VPTVVVDGERVPVVPLTGPLMFQLLRSELDFQNGEWQGPYITSMALAQQTRDPRLARRATEMALSAKRPDEALAAVRLWRELAPESDDAEQYYLGLALMTDDLGEVQALLARKLAAAPAPARGALLYQYQQLLARAPDKTAGANAMDQLAEPYRTTFEGHIVRSQAAFARSELAAARDEANAALALKPDAELAVLALAQATSGEAAVAAVLERFLAAHPLAREVRAAYARVLINQKQFGPARTQFEALLAAQPDQPGTLYALGILSLQLKDNAGAERYLTHFVDVLGRQPGAGRDPSRVLLMLSQIAEERGDDAAALRWLARVDASNAEAHLLARLKQATLQGKHGDLKGARATLDTLASDDADEQAQVALTYGQILRDAGRPQAAFKALQKAARRFPGNPDVLYDYALAAEKIGRVALMETTLREVIAQAPEHHQAYNALGYSLAERNVRLAEAAQLIDKALAMAPDDPFIMDSKGWVEFRLGHLDQAEAMLRRAYALRHDADIAVHLAEVLWQAGKRDAARELLRAARSREPQNAALRSTLARLKLKL
jgi:tetratricopeptide (TPR) repeat protein